MTTTNQKILIVVLMSFVFSFKTHSAIAQTLFEGNIYYKIGSDNNDSADLAITFKKENAKAKMDISIPLAGKNNMNAYTLFISGKESKIYVICKDSQKIKQIKPQFDTSQGIQVSEKRILKTEKKRIIAGVQCTGYELKTGGNDLTKAYIWLADDFVISKKISLGFDIMINNYSIEGRVIMAYSLYMDNKQTDMLKVVKVEKKAIPDSEFTVPKGYAIEEKTVLTGYKTKWVIE